MLKQKGLLGLMVAGFGLLSMAMPGQAQQVVLTPAGTAFLVPPVQPQQQPAIPVLKPEEASEVAFTMTTQGAIAPSQLASAQKQAIEKHGRLTKFKGRDVEILAPDDPRILKVETRRPEAAGTGYIAVLDPTADFMGFKNPELAVWMIPESYILNEPKLPVFSMNDLIRGLPIPQEIRDYKSAMYVGVIGAESPILNPPINPIAPILNRPSIPIINPVGTPDVPIIPIVNPVIHFNPQVGFTPISAPSSIIIGGQYSIDKLGLRDNPDSIRTVAPTRSDDGFYMTTFGQGASVASSSQQEVAAIRIPSIATPASDSAVIPSAKTNGNLWLIPRIDHASPLSASRILPDLR